MYWAVDPATGKVAWQTKVGPDGNGGLGGIEYGTATDGRRIYAAEGDTASIPYTLGGSGPYAGQTVASGSWAALDPAIGKILWQTPDPTGSFDIGFVSAANGVVYGGSTAAAGTNYRKTFTGLGALVLAGAFTAAAIPAFASSLPVTGARIVAHFDIAALQQPENITLEPDGDADVTFAYAHQVARVTPQGNVTILATLPAAASGTTAVSGIVRLPDGTLYVNYVDFGGTASGIWRISPHGTVAQVAALPGSEFLNGLAYDPLTGALFATDATLGAVWKVWPRTGKTEIWASGAEFQPAAGGFGANGLKVHNGSVWVSNTSAGTLLRIPITPGGSAGSPVVVASGLPSIDDFAFTGPGDTLLAVQNQLNQADLITPGGPAHVVLTAADGLSTPSAVAVRGRTVYVTSAAYYTGVDPNLLGAQLDG